MKPLPSVFSSLNSRVKIFVFVANSRRHFSIFMWFNEGLEENNTKFRGHLYRLPFDVRPRYVKLNLSNNLTQLPLNMINSKSPFTYRLCSPFQLGSQVRLQVRYVKLAPIITDFTHINQVLEVFGDHWGQYALNDWFPRDPQCSPRRSRGEHWGRGETNSLFPTGPVIKCFVIPPNSRWNNTLMSAYDFIAKCYKSQ